MQGNHLFGKMRVSGFLLFNDKKIKREKSIGRELHQFQGGLLKKGSVYQHLFLGLRFMRLKTTVVTVKHFYFTKQTDMKIIFPDPPRGAYFVKMCHPCAVVHFVLTIFAAFSTIIDGS